MFRKKNHNIEDTDLIYLENKLKSKGYLKGSNNRVEKSFLEKFFYFFMSLYNAKTYIALFNKLFENADKIWKDLFYNLEMYVEKANLSVGYKRYVLYMYASAFLSSFLTGTLYVLYFFYNKLSRFIPFWFLALGFILVVTMSFSLVFTLFYLYPFHISKQREHNINTNLPFAITHISAIAQSGVPLEKVFQMLSTLGDYGEITLESKKIVNRVTIFGDDIINAITYVAKRTPSEDFKNLLYGIISIVQSGGNLRSYLKEMASVALFNYRLARKRYTETLSTYADIYTALLIAAPLFLVAILAVINIVPDSSIMGMTVDTFMKLGVYGLIPALNIIFLTVLSMTQPEV